MIPVTEGLVGLSAKVGLRVGLSLNEGLGAELSPVFVVLQSSGSSK